MQTLDTLSDKSRQAFNNDDWRVDGLPRIIFPIRFINATGFGLGPQLFASICLFFIEILLVRPALQKSLHQMEQAEKNGKISYLLCNGQARHDMKERLQNYKKDVNNCSSLTCVAKIMNYMAAVKCLRNHQGLLALGEDAHHEKVITPIFIASLPRTGSTILHRVMALDRNRWRSFDFCDQMLPLSPAPIPRNNENARAQLAKTASKLMKGMELMYPGWHACLASVHALEVDQANEDHVWYNSALGHPYVGTLMLLHREEREKANTNGGVSPLNSKECARYRYAWIDMILRIYQHFERKDLPSKNEKTEEYLPWLMKDPRHTSFLPELLSQFPDAKLIFTHRLPVDLFPSVTKLLICNTCTFHTPGSIGTTSEEWGKEILIRTKFLCDSLISFTKDHEGSDLGCSKFTYNKEDETSNHNIKNSSISTLKSTRRFDIRFEDFVLDIPAVIQKIYTQLFPDQPGPTDEVLNKFKSYIQQNRSKSTQRYKLEDFHLSKDDLAFPVYVNLFC